MDKIRTIIAYRHYFEDFLRGQPVKVQNKIYKILEINEFQQRIPSKYIKHIEGSDGLFETIFALGSDIWRVFCFFDEGQLVILLNGFIKKTQKTPKEELHLAKRLKNEYFEEKRKKNNEKRGFNDQNMVDY